MPLKVVKKMFNLEKKTKTQVFSAMYVIKYPLPFRRKEHILYMCVYNIYTHILSRKWNNSRYLPRP